MPLILCPQRAVLTLNMLSKFEANKTYGSLVIFLRYVECFFFDHITKNLMS